ncbi:hypothetical protein PsYK624_085170 [Phanerochaete sordida]|uniref:Uncharacterized protein n=1 Tax=Phanerochaete sordida TaxID=48140 RepID=A0A9P3GCH7_9APHY|nr:hypothetical protein PsYK624_085170 [Phanerochaete sordida]
MSFPAPERGRGAVRGRGKRGRGATPVRGSSTSTDDERASSIARSARSPSVEPTLVRPTSPSRDVSPPPQYTNYWTTDSESETDSETEEDEQVSEGSTCDQGQGSRSAGPSVHEEPPALERPLTREQQEIEDIIFELNREPSPEPEKRLGFGLPEIVSFREFLTGPEIEELEEHLRGDQEVEIHTQDKENTTALPDRQEQRNPSDQWSRPWTEPGNGPYVWQQEDVVDLSYIFAGNPGYERWRKQPQAKRKMSPEPEAPASEPHLEVSDDDEIEEVEAGVVEAESEAEEEVEEESEAEDERDVESEDEISPPPTPFRPYNGPRGRRRRRDDSDSDSDYEETPRKKRVVAPKPERAGRKPHQPQAEAPPKARGRGRQPRANPEIPVPVKVIDNPVAECPAAECTATWPSTSCDYNVVTEHFRTAHGLARYCARFAGGGKVPCPLDHAAEERPPRRAADTKAGRRKGRAAAEGAPKARKAPVFRHVGAQTYKSIGRHISGCHMTYAKYYCPAANCDNASTRRDATQRHMKTCDHVANEWPHLLHLIIGGVSENR